MVEPDRSQMTVLCMRIACCVPKAKNTHSEYVTHIDFPRKQWFDECVSMFRYTYIACLTSMYFLFLYFYSYLIVYLFSSLLSFIFFLPNVFFIYLWNQWAKVHLCIGIGVYKLILIWFLYFINLERNVLHT